MKPNTRRGKAGLKIVDLLKPSHRLQKPIQDWDTIPGAELYYGEIIQVKVGDSSSKLSHMFNQGLVSARLMLNDLDFRKDSKEGIEDKSISKMIDLKKFNANDYTVVFRIIRSGEKVHLPFFPRLSSMIPTRK